MSIVSLWNFYHPDDPFQYPMSRDIRRYLGTEGSSSTIFEEIYIKCGLKDIDRFVKAINFLDTFTHDDYNKDFSKDIENIGHVRMSFNYEKDFVRLSFVLVHEKEVKEYLDTFRLRLAEIFGTENIRYVEKTNQTSKAFNNGYTYSYSSRREW